MSTQSQLSNPDAGREELEPQVEELGHLVEGLDFGGVVAWAKDQDIPGYESLHDMVGSKVISIDGKKATVGWVANGPDVDDVITPDIRVENPGGEDVVVVEGSMTVHRYADDNNRHRTDWAQGTAKRPGFLQFDGGETIRLQSPRGPEGKCWYVCFYPESE